MNLRKRTWEIVEVAKPGDRASRLFDLFILGLILLNVAAVVLESMDWLGTAYASVLWRFEVASVAVFTGEYLARLWSCVEDERFSRPYVGRLRFVLRPLVVIDLLAFLPFYVSFARIDLRFLRALRLTRVVRVFKVGRYSSSLRMLGRVLRAKREDLVLTTGVMFLLLIVASCLMYMAEHEVQPEEFPNIPAAMWWAVATLTTVGYGDVYPVTLFGKLLASVVAVLGIGLFALPTGILGAGFVEEIQNRRQPKSCPHCGGEI